jgi:hypothetical protein
LDGGGGNTKERNDTSFFGILCDHALVMIAALEQPSGHARRDTMMELGMELWQVHQNWITLLCDGVPPERREFRNHVVKLVRRFAHLLLALVTEDERCTVSELTESKELEAMAALYHTALGHISNETLRHFRNYVSSLCVLYEAQYGDSVFLHRDPGTRAKCNVLLMAGVLGRWLDYVKTK